MTRRPRAAGFSPRERSRRLKPAARERIKVRTPGGWGEESSKELRLYPNESAFDSPRSQPQSVAARPAARGALGFALYSLLLCGPTFWSGCSRDASSADRRPRTVTVQSTTLYGLTLDKDATPRQVAYVVLRAIREDFEAETKAQREAALDKQFQICAANVIQRSNAGGLSRDKFVHKVVSLWTPTVSHYVSGFETEWAPAAARLRPTTPRLIEGDVSSAQECEVVLEVDDPEGDPNAGVILVVWLAQDRGLWRVIHLGFDPSARSIEKLTRRTND